MLPKGYEEAVMKTGALKRKREIKTASDLLMLVFLYVAQGLSHTEVSVRMRLQQADIGCRNCS